MFQKGETTSRKSKKRTDKADICPEASKEWTLHVHMLVESLGILFKNTFYDDDSASGLYLT